MDYPSFFIYGETKVSKKNDFHKSCAKETAGLGFIQFLFIKKRGFPLQLYLSNKYILDGLNYCFGKIIYLK